MYIIYAENLYQKNLDELRTKRNKSKTPQNESI